MTMESTRIEYIDKLKDFAIILVVLGHVLEKSFGISDTALNYFYGSFHMPLFMFLSGIFSQKGFQSYNLVECRTYVVNKALRLIVPFISLGGILSLLMYHNLHSVWIGEENKSLWFLPALFYCVTFEMLVSSLSKRIRRDADWMYDLIFHVVVWCIACFPYIVWRDAIPYYLHFLKLYPFFVFGIFFNRYNSLHLKILNSEYIYTGSFILYLLSIYLQYAYSISFLFSGFFAIVILVNLFVYYDSKIPKTLSRVGVKSLQIYTLHWFLLPSSVVIKWSYREGILDNQNIVLFFLLGFVIAVPIVMVCMLMDILIKRNHTLSIIFWGGK